MDWTELVSKLKVWQIGGALFFGGSTILVLGHFGLSPLSAELNGYVFIGTVAGAWLFILALIPIAVDFWSRLKLEKEREAHEREEEKQLDQLRSHLLTVLRPEQRHHMAAIKQRGQIAFQAYDNGELDDLCSLRLLTKSGHIVHGLALFVVPDVVWNNFDLSPQDIKLLQQYQPAWVRHTDMPSHVIFRR